jgi:histidinol-phosphatase (PHP family)
MKILANYHTHSHFSDGSSAPLNYIQEAIEQGFTSLGFSEHSVLPFENTFALQQGREHDYAREISRLKKEFSQNLEILMALEADYIPGMSTGFSTLKKGLGLDYIIGSVHLVRNSHPDKLWFIDGPRRETYDDGLKELFDGDIRKGVSAYWHQINQMLMNEEFDIVGHLDKIKMHNQGRWFNESDEWYTSLVKETVALIAEKGVIVEVNTRGIYKGRSESLFPGEYILQLLHERGVPVTISSDAHQPGEISLLFDEAQKTLQSCGYREIFHFSNGSWKPVSFS